MYPIVLLSLTPLGRVSWSGKKLSEQSNVDRTMSELARNELDEEWTAFELKDEYLRFGTRFEWFVCSFCDTEVTPAAVYGDHYVKSPYFTLAKSDNPHSFNCPYGKGGLKQHGIERSIPRRQHAFEVDLPERLIPIRVRVTRANGTKQPPKGLASPELIVQRVRSGTDQLKIANQYTTGLLHTLAVARASAMRELRALAEKKGVPGKDQWAFVNAELKKYPLSLYGTHYNYNSAFHKTNHEPWKGSFIYHGDATIRSTGTGFELTSKDVVRTKGRDKEVPFIVSVACDRANPVNKMEAKTVAILEAKEREGQIVRWYAYGEPSGGADDSYILNVSDPAHICVLR